MPTETAWASDTVLHKTMHTSEHQLDGYDENVMERVFMMVMVMVVVQMDDIQGSGLQLKAFGLCIPFTPPPKLFCWCIIANGHHTTT